MPLLPVELILTIFGYLQDDPGSLSSCSLVCHGWVHLARQYLFAVMNTTLPPSPMGKPYRLPRSIISIINSASIRIGYIKKLHIEEGYNYPLRAATLQGSVIYQLVAKLPKLQSLQFVNVPITLFEPIDGNIRLSLKSLELKYGEATVRDLITSTAVVLQLFSAIETLSIITEYPANLMRFTGFRHPQVHRLHGVRIGHLRLDVTLPQFRLLHDLIDIGCSVGTISLRPHMTQWVHANDFGLMIRDISSKIVSLTLSHWHPYRSFLKSNSTRKLILLFTLHVMVYQQRT